MHAEPSAQPALLTKAQAAQFLTTSIRHLDELWRKRQIAGVRIGRDIRFLQSDLEEYIQRRRVAAASELIDRTTVAQGLERQVTDPVALRQVAQVLVEEDGTSHIRAQGGDAA